TARGRLPIIAGGTGLYVDSLLNHVQFREEQRDEAYAAQLRAELLQNGVEPLLQRLWEVDAASARRLSAEKNPKRIIRALEFYHTTGTTITEQLAQSRQTPSPYRAVKLGLNYKDRQKLYDRINRRVDQMLAQGLIEEAQRVLASPLSCTSVMAIGYKELAPYFKEEAALEECIEKLKRETRRYAKRQLTWFRRDKEIHWLYADEYDSFEELYAAAVQTINEGLVYG
ncbi:MAG: tRNA (adenosine(37)-N6)-dimethylallyltransferase MiaA, partial [Ruminococcus sp.]|nr:tRNA (adenosine(37)-N6)-dimethylallyltransferase MiaA [Ruminococcus sp.]